MKTINSQIPFNYITVKTTKSRIDKGLLAIPVSLVDLFPKTSAKILLLNESGTGVSKSFTPYTSSSRECRIGGLKEFYAKYNIKDGDELVIQIYDDDKFKIIPERVFEKQVLDLETKIDKSIDEEETDKNINRLSQITNSNTTEVLKSEFIRLSNKEISKRKSKLIPKSRVKECVPASVKKILLGLYKGKCQISGFSFLMRNGNPYFEIHHIDPFIGNHLKNILVVSPNVHSQFTYADLEQSFDNDGWLRKVKFNTKSHKVFQIIDLLPKIFEKEIHT